MALFRAVPIAMALAASPLLTAAAARAAGPSAPARPTIAGAAVVGARLNAVSGSWTGSGTVRVSYQWHRCDATGAHCSSIHGATASSYTLVAADAGKTVGVTVTGTDSTGATPAYSSLVGPIAAKSSPLTSTTQPGITGTAAVAGTLTATPGSWTPAPSALSYAWERCNANGRICLPIAGATAATYAATAADAGHALLVDVQATAGSAVQWALSIATQPVAAPAQPAAGTATKPAVSGTARVRERLTATPAPAAAGATFAYQWYRCDPTGAHCSSVHGATGTAYTTVAADADETIGLTVTVTAAGATTPTYASLVGPIAAAGTTFVSTSQPTIAGNAVQGQALTASAGTWSTQPTALSYTWDRCNANGRICAPIAGAAAATYTPAAADVGHALVAILHATSGSAVQTAFSVATPAVTTPPPLANTSAPTVTGTARTGQQLTASPGTWVGTAPISTTYQWYRCDATGAHCSSIHGATKSTYRTVAADGGHTLGLTVNAKDATAATTAAYASLVGPVVAGTTALATTVQPAITGTPKPGSTLTVGTGTWSATPTTVTDQWERCNANARICVAIAGATTATYTPTAADVGHALLAIVQATVGSTVQPAFSTATPAVASS